MSIPGQAERITQLRRLYEEVLDHLIDEELFKQAARRMRIRVGDDDVERAIQNVMRQNNLTIEELREALQEQGINEASYRQDLRSQILRFKVMNERVRGRVNITEADVRRRYDQSIRSSNRQLRFRVSHVFFALPEGATATDVAATRDRARDVRRAIRTETFTQAIAENAGGEIGWVRQGELPEVLERALLGLEPGQISDPVRGEEGFHILMLDERETGDASIPGFEAVKERIFNEMLDQAMARQEHIFVDELRREALITKRL
jgi:peptidyl-prolyl cis-trans isomerase SurA